MSQLSGMGLAQKDATLLLPLAGEGDPAKRGRMRGLADFPSMQAQAGRSLIRPDFVGPPSPASGRRRDRALSGLARVLLALAALYAGGCLLGLVLLVAGFRLGLLGGIDILFYRGLVLVALGAAATFAILALGLRRLGMAALGTRDAFAVSVVSLALNLSFLVVVPVTVDRSISIFLLGAMAAHPDAALTPEQASTLFKTVYVDDYRQIDRRLREQAVSGNLEKVGDAYRISPRGRAVVAAAKASAWLFDSRAGLVSPRDHESSVSVR